MTISKYLNACISILAISRTNRVAAITFAQVEQTFDSLQTWYNSSIGLWVPSTGWWNSANCLTILANLAAIDNGIKARTDDLWEEVFVNAAQHNSLVTAAIGPTWRSNLVAASAWSSSYGLSHIGDGQHVGFINDFYDDEGWWALAWIAVYDLSHDSKYLDQAVTIFNDLDAAWNSTPVGGLWWNKKHEYVNAITNELYFSIAAHLANRCPDDRQRYINSAQAAWRWLFSSGMFTSQRNIKDGLAVGSNPGATEIVWSYNQGVVLSALTELAAATSQDLYVGIAKLIADAALANLTSTGDNDDSIATLQDPCEAEMWCGIDGATFKGIFARNLAHLHSVSPEDKYSEFLQNNADALWTRSRDQYNRLGLVWGGPFAEPAGASMQCSGMDLFVGALSQLGEWNSDTESVKGGITKRSFNTARAMRSTRKLFGLW